MRRRGSPREPDEQDGGEDGDDDEHEFDLDERRPPGARGRGLTGPLVMTPGFLASERVQHQTALPPWRDSIMATSGRNIAMTMPPMMTPRNTMSMGSMSLMRPETDVHFLVVVVGDLQEHGVHVAGLFADVDHVHDDRVAHLALAGAGETPPSRMESCTRVSSLEDVVARRVARDEHRLDDRHAGRDERAQRA